jgi:hypothetical protein
MSLTARPEITDKSRRVSAIDRLRTANVRLPTFRELAKPETVAANTETSLKAVDPDAAGATRRSPACPPEGNYPQ